MADKVLYCETPAKKKRGLIISVTHLKRQIDAVLLSNMPENEKTGVHHLLGDILDLITD